MTAASAVEVGSVLDGVVAGISHFGAFVQLPNGKTGLVHISEVADTYVRDIRDFLKEGDPVRVKVVSVDEPRGKIALSIKQADSNHRPAPKAGPPRRANSASFEDKLARFLKASDEKISDLRRKTDAKRGGRGSRV